MRTVPKLNWGCLGALAACVLFWLAVGYLFAYVLPRP